MGDFPAARFWWNFAVRTHSTWAFILFIWYVGFLLITYLLTAAGLILFLVGTMNKNYASDISESVWNLIPAPLAFAWGISTIYTSLGAFLVYFDYC